MFDSSSKYPDGVLYGHTKHLGNFDECYNLQVDVGKVENKINGRYCLVDLEYKRKDAPTFHKPTMDYDPNESFWEAIEVYYYKYRLGVVHIYNIYFTNKDEKDSF